MLIRETSVFTRRLGTLLDDESYRLLQLALLQNPERGSVIPGSGGLRKLRWSVGGRGKRGGLRLIYYWFSESEVILMLMIYSKSEQEDLSSAQKRVIREMIGRERE